MVNDHPPDIDRARAHVHHPRRRVSVGGHTFHTGNTDIRVWHTGHTATFRLTLWNITQSTWAAIRRDDHVEVELGWQHGPLSTVAEGSVTSKSAIARGDDYRYQITGRTDGSVAVRERVSRSWQDATTREIARGIASELGLDVGYIGPPADSDSRFTPPTFDGYYQIRDTQQVGAWLDELVADAGRKTGEQYEWYIDRGALSLHAKRDFPPETARVTTADSILELHHHQGDTAQTNDVDARRAVAYCQPAFRKHATIEVAHTTGGKARRQGGNRPEAVQPSDTNATRRYRCASYQFESGTTIGHHLTRAVLVPEVARYDYDAPGPGRGGEAA